MWLCRWLPERARWSLAGEQDRQRKRVNPTVTHIRFSYAAHREFLALATRAIDRTFYKKRFFVIASTNSRDVCGGRHFGAHDGCHSHPFSNERTMSPGYSHS